MNCKPGDLAVISATAPISKNVGRFVRVIRRSPVFVRLHDDDWEVESLSRIYNGSTGRWVRSGSIGAARDKYLRPINDPGDDARDETLSWLPVPSKEVA